MRTLSIKKPDDWHVHLRDNDALIHTVPATAKHFARALAMPNLQPPLTTVPSLNRYYERIVANIPAKSPFHPYLTLYLHENLAPDIFIEAKPYSYILGAKLYPAGATTNSEHGAHSIRALYPIFEALQESDLVLQIHGEVTEGDIFSREKLFIEKHLATIIKNFPKLRVVLEHISTKAAVEFVIQAPDTVSATITPQHLLYNRNQLLVGGIKPHYYCLPILKHRNDQLSLQAAAVSGNPKFFAGTDSAPHARNQKESACGCAGIYSAPFALAMYTQLFDDLNQLSALEAFMSCYGANFYRLPITEERIELVEQQQTIPEILPLGREQVVPIAAGSHLRWSVRDDQ